MYVVPRAVLRSQIKPVSPWYPNWVPISVEDTTVNCWDMGLKAVSAICHRGAIPQFLLFRVLYMKKVGCCMKPGWSFKEYGSQGTLLRLSLPLWEDRALPALNHLPPLGYKKVIKASPVFVGFELSDGNDRSVMWQPIPCLYGWIRWLILSSNFMP